MNFHRQTRRPHYVADKVLVEMNGFVATPGLGKHYRYFVQEARGIRSTS